MKEAVRKVRTWRKIRLCVDCAVRDEGGLDGVEGGGCGMLAVGGGGGGGRKKI